MTQHQFFQQFVPQNIQTTSQNPKYIVYNETILEIVNNWEFVQDLMKRSREGSLCQVDILEQLWFNFIITNNIDITFFKNEEEFLDANWKIN